MKTSFISFLEVYLTPALNRNVPVVSTVWIHFFFSTADFTCNETGPRLFLFCFFLCFGFFILLAPVGLDCGALPDAGTGPGCSRSVAATAVTVSSRRPTAGRWKHHMERFPGGCVPAGSFDTSRRSATLVSFSFISPFLLRLASSFMRLCVCVCVCVCVLLFSSQNALCFYF